MANKPAEIDRQDFLKEFTRLKKGSVTRRHFLSVTGIAAATAFLGAGSTFTAAAEATGLGRKVTLATWPNYHDPQTFEDFTNTYGVEVAISIIGSNEGMMRALELGRGWDIIVPTQYAIAPYVERGMLQPLDLALIPNFNPATHLQRHLSPSIINGASYAVPKNAGTTGMAYNRRQLYPLSSWRDFFDVAMNEASGRTIVHDYQLTAIGNALVALGHGFNSCDPTELAAAEALLMQVKPHLHSIDSDYQPAMRAGEAWLTMCWSNDAYQMAEGGDIGFNLGSDGGEIWTDFFAIPSQAQNPRGAHALINHLMDPKTAAQEHLCNGGTIVDSRVKAYLPEEVLTNHITQPDEASLTPLEFGIAQVLTDPIRADIMNRFRSAGG
ncbi:ABC transporter substrate-binding protein [Rhizobium glycinendophyticum]|uniref:Spermidine/putrescine ABC transporter substrate-binding protein n=1 Tax=Rhizobium glycinendophyticum TaxID=2589807 RepID=A0A504UEJ8_9HYPH|nr:spermidine/putrescine ABC transporter substrate-binding protein [Rhizobium glycinendophyticum]TPP11510.1 spermidine/putrescine ABC transporter substrate-binding protein [Rhizobium glycinendophyticum]